MISARLARGPWRRNPCSWWSATGRPSASTTGMAAIRRPRMRSSASTRDCPASTATKRSFATGASGSSRPRPARMARRRSPSVAMPTRRPASSTDEHDPAGTPVDGLEPVADRRVVPDDAAGELVRHEADLGRAGTPSTVASSGTSATTTAPIADRGARPDADVVPDRGADADRRVVPDRGRAADDRARREVAERADPHVVLDDHAGVDDRVRPDDRAGVHDRARQHDGAGLDAGAGRDPGGGVDDHGPAGVGAHGRDDPAPRLGRRAEPDDEPRAVAGPGGVEPGSQGRVVGLVDQLDDPPRRRVGAGGLGDDARVLADAQDDQRAGRHAGTRIGGLRGGRGGRHAAMICATRAPARPSGASPAGGPEPLPEARRRARGGARRRPRPGRPGRR